jgi:SUKH-3 immunity protein
MTDFTWLTEVTQRAVEKAGWTPDRRVDIETWTAELVSEGYFVSSLAREILANFGGLTVIPPPDVPEAQYGNSPLRFYPVDAGGGLHERYAELELDLGHRMTPLVDMGGDYIVLLLDDGRVVCDSSFALELLADNFPEALDLLVRRYRRPEILIDYDSSDAPGEPGSSSALS